MSDLFWYGLHLFLRLVSTCLYDLDSSLNNQKNLHQSRLLSTFGRGRLKPRSGDFFRPQHEFSSKAKTSRCFQRSCSSLGTRQPSAGTAQNTCDE
ncbi:hypothetical protein BJ166DRAFT_535640 [Pestalotiopsis sp. NC0098]|nr:hypothetical protein BJ166DRAFT_535640 [Pestalotiopsis sp. NC0098]